MRGLQIVPYNTKINFVGLRFLAYGIALFIVLGSFFSIGFKGFNLGIDFKGGLLIEARTPQKVDIAELRSKLSSLGIGEIKLQSFGSDQDILIRMEHPKNEKENVASRVQKIKDTLGSGVECRRIETVGAKVSQELIENGIWALGFALIGMLIYIWVRFEWQYGLCGILALIHDAIAVLGFYSVSGFEFNESAFAALLTTIGYSINDSVVIYDRLRENLRKYKTTSIADLINLSANETLSRTLLTSGTTLLALVALYFFGGPVIENFSLPIIVGIVVGTMSSIFISVNLLLFFDLRKKKEDVIVPSGPVGR